MWSVTVVANGHTVMTSFEPRGVVVIHHMAIRAGGGVISEVGIPFSVDERVDANARGETENGAKEEEIEAARSHAGIYGSDSVDKPKICTHGMQIRRRPSTNVHDIVLYGRS